jgi:hypothetical protein
MVEIERGVHLAHDAVLTAVMHVRRLVAIVTAAAEDVAGELGDMVWDYQHMASAEPRSEAE